MKEYLNIVERTLACGVNKEPVRFDADGNIVKLDNGTTGIFAAIFRHNMSDGFPLLTTKKMPIKTIAVELEGFIKGITSKRWYQERNCKIWNEWCNPQEVPKSITQEEKKLFALGCDDLGPIYGYQWRRFDEAYNVKDDGVMKGYDQLKSIVDKLKTNPYDRRMICSAWNPNQLSQQALPACHMMFNVVVYGNKLNLIWHQRSCDLMYGVPFNIASYAMLLLLLAKEAGLDPGELVGTLNDCHIYDNQLESAREQLTRTPLELPTLEILTPEGQEFSIFNWTHKDIKLNNYVSYEKLSFGAVTV